MILFMEGTEIAADPHRMKSFGNLFFIALNRLCPRYREEAFTPGPDTADLIQVASPDMNAA